MNTIIRKIPVPMSGLMLALAAIGNLLSTYGDFYRYFFGAAAAILLVLLALKAICTPESLIEGLANPVIASTMPTFSMGLMILAAYVKPFFPTAALGIWILGLIIHVLLMMLFTGKHMLNFNIMKIYPSYFIVYVGIICGSVSAPALGLHSLGRYLFWFGFVAYLLLLPFILYRVVAVKEMPEPAAPTLTILAAPASLCLAGYLSSFQEKNMAMIAFLGILSLVMLIYVLANMPRLLKLKFYPSYSAFTFPFVITAIAMKGTYTFLAKSGIAAAPLGYFITLLEIWSIIMVIYVSIKYAAFIVSASKPVGVYSSGPTQTS